MVERTANNKFEMAVRQHNCSLILISIPILSFRNQRKSRNLSQNGQSSGEYFDCTFLNLKHSIRLLQQNCLVSWQETWHIHFESNDYKVFVKDQKGITLNKFLTSQTRDLLEKQKSLSQSRNVLCFAEPKLILLIAWGCNPIPPQAHILGLLWTQNCMCWFQILIRCQPSGKRNKKVTMRCICITNVAMEKQCYIFSVSVTLVI